jgi:hypothetical protein
MQVNDALVIFAMKLIIFILPKLKIKKTLLIHFLIKKTIPRALESYY